MSKLFDTLRKEMLKAQKIAAAKKTRQLRKELKKPQMKYIYLASPFSSKLKSSRLRDLEEHFRAELITIVGAKLTKKYKNTIALDLPITTSYCMRVYEPSLKGDFAEWADRDLFIIREKADELWVVTMKGWDKSIGVKAEIECAKQYNKPIKYVNPATLKITDTAEIA